MLRALVAALALVGFAQQATWPTFSADELARRTIERRAVEAVIWGMPRRQLRSHATGGDSRSKGRGEPDRLLVTTAELEEPDAYSQP